MHECSSKQELVEHHALMALRHLSDADQEKVLEYIEHLLTLEKVKNDQGSSTQD